MVALTRRYRFSASHRLHSVALSPDENAALYGKCNHPFGHGHNYVLDVTADGQVDERTGVLMPVARLDDLVRQHVLQLFASRNINLDVAQFRGLVPTTENIAVVIAQLLEEAWDDFAGPGVYLRRVQIQETERNSFEVVIGRSAGLETERVFANAESQIV